MNENMTWPKIFEILISLTQSVVYDVFIAVWQIYIIAIYDQVWVTVISETDQNWDK